MSFFASPGFRNSLNIFLALLTLVAVAVFVTFPVGDFDTFWHVANGREMVNTGTIINHEVFSYTAAGKEFHNHEWLSQLLFYLFYDFAGGADGLIVLKIILTLATGAVLLLASVKRSGNLPLCLLFIMLAVLAAPYRYVVRPHLFSFLGLALLFYLLFSFQRGAAARKSLVYVPLVMLLWDTLHGAIYGLIFLVSFTSGETIKFFLAARFPSWSGLSPLSNRSFRTLLIWMALTLLVMLVSPYGLTTYDVFIEFINKNIMASMTSEFQPTTLDGNFIFWSILALTMVSFAVSAKAADLTDFLIALPFAYLAVRYVRCTGVFCLIAVPILTANLSAAINKYRRRYEFLSWGTGLVAGLGIMLCTGYAIQEKFIAPAADLKFGLGINENIFPVGSTRFIKDVNLQGNLYNTDRFGGYLAFFLTPQRKIFHYNHHTLFTALEKFVHDPDSRAQWRINYALIGREDEWEMFSRDGYLPVYWEPTGAVMLKDSPENKQILDTYAIRYFQPLMPEDTYIKLAQNQTTRARLAMETANYLAYRQDNRMTELLCRIVTMPNKQLALDYMMDVLLRADKYNGQNASLNEILGILLYQKKDFKNAEIRLQKALAIDGSRQKARLNLAYLLYDQKSFDAALDHFNILIQTDPGFADAYYGMGLCYYQTRRFDLARSYWLKFLKLVPNGPWAEKAKDFIADLPK